MSSKESMKKEPISLFPGSNTCAGFAGFFEDIRQAAKRTVILKGGPGVGKSTLMREAGQRWEAQGLSVVYYRCSGDPDSLDAVFAKETGFLVLDGTAPHIMDPACPGAADSILNLGICLKEDVLRKELPVIQDIQAESAHRYARATRCLAAAERFRADAAAVYKHALPEAQCRELSEQLFRSLPDGPEGACRRAFAQAVTCKGVIQCLDGILENRVICLDVPWGFDVHSLLLPLLHEAQRRRAAVHVYADPLDAEKIGHLAVGDTLFTTAVMMDAPVLAPAFDREKLARENSALAFDKAVYELALHQAIEALADAKQCHDRLERVYIDAMDYAVLKAVKQEFLESLPQ